MSNFKNTTFLPWLSWFFPQNKLYLHNTTSCTGIKITFHVTPVVTSQMWFLTSQLPRIYASLPKTQQRINHTLRYYAGIDACVVYLNTTYESFVSNLFGNRHIFSWPLQKFFNSVKFHRKLRFSKTPSEITNLGTLRKSGIFYTRGKFCPWVGGGGGGDNREVKINVYGRPVTTNTKLQFAFEGKF